MKVYGIGYQGRKTKDIEVLARDREAVLVDVRFSANSYNPDFRGGKLRLRFGSRYVHVREFGNVNYKGGPIQIADFEAGLQKIIDLGEDVILMCACKDPARCHRTILMQRLAEMGYEIEELNDPVSASPSPSPNKPEGPQQLTLF